MNVKCECKHCGGPIIVHHEDANQVIDCPHCGQKTFLAVTRPPQSPPPIRSQRMGKSPAVWIVIGTIGFIVVMIFAAALVSPDGSVGSSPSEKRTLNVGITHSSSILSLENKSSENWSGVIAYINDSPPGGYKFNVGSIAAGETKSIFLHEFTKKDGQRFNPTAFKVTQIWVGGGGYDYEGYGTK